MRLQLALNVSDLDRAVDFYRNLFGVAPTKRKPGYAQFAVEAPPLKLVLFEEPAAVERGERLNHLGVEVFDEADVPAATERLRAAGLAELVEDESTCCYARQDKVWAVEPDGLRWEWYRVLADTEDFGDDRPTPEAALEGPPEAAKSSPSVASPAALEPCC